MSYISEFDKRFYMTVISRSPDPERTAWYALHQCYSEGDTMHSPLPQDYGDAVVKHLLSGNRGHYSPLEHNSITLAVIGFPHSVMQQVRTHRVGVSFSVQSTRYTGNRIVDGCFSSDNSKMLDIFYTRPPGEYRTRSGEKFLVTASDYAYTYGTFQSMANEYTQLITKGYSHEAARYVLPGYALRQNWVFTCNVRSLMHLLDLRHKPDAELETQEWAKLLFQVFVDWCPNVAAWYEDKRLNKGLLAP